MIDFAAYFAISLTCKDWKAGKSLKYSIIWLRCVVEIVYIKVLNHGKKRPPYSDMFSEAFFIENNKLSMLMSYNGSRSDRIV